MWDNTAISLLDLLSITSVTILTILIPVYVIAFSLVGPSSGRRKEEIDRINAEKEQTNREAIDDAKSLLGEDNTREAQQKLLELERRQIEIEKERGKLERRYSALGLKQALLLPSILLIITAVSFKTAPIFYKAFYYYSSLIVLLAGIAALIIAIRMILTTLSLVEELGKMVPDFNRQELKSVLNDVIQVWEKKKKETENHRINIVWVNDPPFQLTCKENRKISYGLNLKVGNTANDLKVLFLIPPGFKFAGHSSWAQGEDRGDIAGYLTAWDKIGKINKGVTRSSSIAIANVDNDEGSYKAYYRIVSDEYADEERNEFEIVVKETEQET